MLSLSVQSLSVQKKTRPCDSTTIFPVFYYWYKMVTFLTIYYSKIHPPTHSAETHQIRIFYFLHYNNISFYIFDNSFILPIRPMNTTVLQLKTDSIELISTVGSLPIGHYLVHMSHFSIGSTRNTSYYAP
jgi:hypothetical protein